MRILIKLLNLLNGTNALTIILMTGVSFASDSSNGGSDTCGLGWQITSQKTMVGTLVRGVTNASTIPTWSMSSGTSGCQKHYIVKKDEKAVQYVASNFYPLSAEMAEGHGEYLAGLAQVMGCNDSVVLDFSQVTKKSFSKIIDHADAYQVLQNVKKAIQNNEILTQNCTTT